tara:strand:+ start:1106 stop:1273 length:168 start_codon:yes stop_codon:yes gene_type:complete
MDVNNPTNNNIEKCKTVMSKKQLIPLLSIRDVVGGTYMVIPWTILLIIVGIVIII